MCVYMCDLIKCKIIKLSMIYQHVAKIKYQIKLGEKMQKCT